MVHEYMQLQWCHFDTRHDPRVTMTHIIRYDAQVVCVILGDIRLTRVHMSK